MHALAPPPFLSLSFRLGLEARERGGKRKKKNQQKGKRRELHGDLSLVLNCDRCRVLGVRFSRI